ncbi:hypothetical protein ACWED2_05460 [Amycolatopsis sp. NPDC005003]
MGEQVPSRAEFVQAAVWLGRRGVRVGIPSRLLATRLGVRGNARPLWGRQVVIAGAFGYQCLLYLPGVRGVEMTESKSLLALGAVVSAVIVTGVLRRPVLPDGGYGIPLPAQAVAGWSPEDAR